MKLNNTNSFLFLKNGDIDNLLEYCREVAERKKLLRTIFRWVFSLLRFV